ncbi:MULTISPECIES: competence protein CoiA [Bacillaceae]|uniref:Competence protein CoiA n=1 Tax=Evansella alkalicola TaxID=745819 RepID=A0ABS6JT77_9BACI|nr:MULTISPECIES: competence protein CoiA family protein [Bacillaceae]MBU9721783.1 competence protein CoiA [Bacillus alkalicola]
MFVAEKKDGTIINLFGEVWNRDDLLQERKATVFYCPKCKEKVTLKLGNYQAWHFAHLPHSQCSLASSGGETKEHGMAKHMIFNWLSSHGYDPKLEFFIPEINQRADIFVRMNKEPFIFEIQRSTLSNEDYLRRRKGYEDLGYEQIWIGLTSQLRQQYYEFSSSQLNQILIRFKPNPVALYLDIEKQLWLQLTDFFSLSPQKTMAIPKTMSLSVPPVELLQDDASFSPALSFYDDLCFSRWLSNTKKKRLRGYMRLSKTEWTLHNLFQQYHVNLNYFPALACLPLRSNLYFQTHPQWWQSWIILTIINPSELNTSVSLSTLTNKMFLQLKCMQYRPFPLHPKSMLRHALEEYFDILCKFHVLEKHFAGVYYIRNHININKQLDTLCMDDVYVQKKIKEEWRENYLGFRKVIKGV